MSSYGYGPGPYLFGGPEGLEKALEQFEHACGARQPAVANNILGTDLAQFYNSEESAASSNAKSG